MIQSKVLRPTFKDKKSEYFKVLEYHYKSNGNRFIQGDLEKELDRVETADDTLILKTPSLMKRVIRRNTKPSLRSKADYGDIKHSFLPYYEQRTDLCRLLKRNETYACSDDETKEQILIRILAYAKKHKISPKDACALFLLGNNGIIQGEYPSVEELTALTVCSAMILSGIFAFIYSSVMLVPALLLPFCCLCATATELIASVTAQKPIIPLCREDSNKCRLIVISCDDGNFDRLIKKCESILRTCTDEKLCVAGVISLSASFCLKRQHDSVFTEIAEKAANTLTEKYGCRFGLYIRKRQYDPKKKCYYSHCNRFDDLYDLLTESNTAFEYVYTFRSERNFGYALTLPVDCTVDPSQLESVWKKLGGSTAMIRLSPERHLSVKHTLFSRFCLGLHERQKERRATYLALCSPCGLSSYAFVCESFCSAYGQKPLFDALSLKLMLTDDGKIKIRRKCDVSPISPICRNSVRIMHLLNGFSALPFKAKLLRGYALITALAPFLCFYMILASVASPFSSLYLTLSFFIIALSNADLITSCGRALKKRNYTEALSSAVLYFADVIYRISMLPFSFTVGCYLLLKKVISPFSGRPFHGIEENGPGLFFVFALSALLFGALFFIFDIDPFRRMLSLIWICSPVTLGILSLSRGGFNTNKD